MTERRQTDAVAAPLATGKGDPSRLQALSDPLPQGIQTLRDQQEQGKAARVEDSQYAAPLATAATNEDLRAEVEALQRRLRQSVCVYCGEATDHQTADARLAWMVDHCLTCPKRPEARLFDMLDAMRSGVTVVLEQMALYVLDEDRCGSDEEEYEHLSATLLPRWCDAIRTALAASPLLLQQGQETRDPEERKGSDGANGQPASHATDPATAALSGNEG